MKKTRNITIVLATILILSTFFKPSTGAVIAAAQREKLGQMTFNTPPVADNQEVGTAVSQTVAFTLTGSDADGDELLFNLTSFPQHGVLNGYIPSFEYIPQAGYYGSDSFTFVVFDGTVESSPATVNITITRPPVANAQTVTTVHDHTKAFTLTGSDPDGDALLFNLTAFPQHGVLNGYIPNFEYIPEPGYVGEDSLTFVVFDGIVESEPATVTFELTNAAPVANAQTVTTVHDHTKAFTLTGSDPDGDALLFNLTAFPQHGVLNGYIPNFEYIPEPGYVGEDSLTFVVFDGIVESEPATVTFELTNTAPVAESQIISLVHDTIPSFTLSGSDADGDALLFNVTAFPQNGILRGYIPNFEYMPIDGFVGQDSFSFVVFDGAVESEPATVTFLVTNMIPVANNLSVSTLVNESVALALSASDADGDSLNYVTLTLPAHGQLEGTAPNLTYIPDTGFAGQDSFTFSATDGIATSTPATVTITVTSAEPQIIYEENFEVPSGWVRNPNGTDTAQKGLWEVADPEYSWYFGWKQLGSTTSGSKDLVTGAKAGRLPGDNDVDFGTTSMRSPLITLPSGRMITLSLNYYLAHAANSSNADYLKIKIVGLQTREVLSVLGRNRDIDAVWNSVTVDVSDFAGQSVYILVEAADLVSQSLVEAAVDDIVIVAQ